MPQGWPTCHQAMLDLAVDAREDPAVRACALNALQRMLDQCSASLDAGTCQPADGSIQQGGGGDESVAEYDVAELLARREFWTERLDEVRLFTRFPRCFRTWALDYTLGNPTSLEPKLEEESHAERPQSLWISHPAIVTECRRPWERTPA